jgi:two-component system, OmpR family, phosphate regulon response regulator PhoB
MSANPSSKASRRKPRLLIVEDDPDLRVLIQFAAKRSEVFSTISTAENGEDALEQVNAGLQGTRADMPPDVIFTDYNMPRVNGLELAKELQRKKETRSIPVALFTAAQSDPRPATAEAAGCRAVYQKPASFRELLRIMRALPNLCRGSQDVFTDGTASPFPPRSETSRSKDHPGRDQFTRGAA